MKKIIGYIIVSAAVVLSGVWVAAQVTLNDFRAGEVISSTEVDQNFQALLGALGTKQTKVSDTCAAGSAIRVINEDGTVECEVDNTAGSGGSAGVVSLNGQTGDITLQEGSNISIDAGTEGQIVISTTGGGGGGDIAAVNAATGLTGGGETGEVSLAVAESFRLPQTCADGEVAKAQGGLWVCAGDETGSGEPSVLPAVNVRPDLQQAIPTNDETLITFDTAEFEQGGELFSTAQPSRLVAPTTGIYAIDVQIGWRAEGSINGGFHTAELFVNANGSCSGAGLDSKARDFESFDGNGAEDNHLSLLKRLEAGDHVEVCVVQGTGQDQFVEGFGQTWATMHLVSPVE